MLESMLQDRLNTHSKRIKELEQSMALLQDQKDAMEVKLENLMAILADSWSINEGAKIEIRKLIYGEDNKSPQKDV